MAKQLREEAIERARSANLPLCKLCRDTLAQQADARLLFAGAAFVQKKAEALSLQSTEADDTQSDDDFAVQTETIDVLSRGPQTEREFARIGAMAVRAYAEEPSPKDFVRHADWLEINTTYSLYAFVDTFFDDAETVWGSVADALAADEDGSAAARARCAARSSTLQRAGATELLALVMRTHADPFVSRMLGSDALSASVREGLAQQGSGTLQSLVGTLGSRPPKGLRGVLRIVTGWALLTWVGKGILSAAGFKRQATLSLQSKELHVAEERRVFGKSISHAEHQHSLNALASAGRETLYPSLHFLVGAIALAAGIIVGGLYIFDGIRSGETILLLLGAVIVLAGAGLDFALNLWNGKRERVCVHLDFAQERLSLKNVTRENADAFLESLRGRIER